jgi:hypothetical protein
MNAEQHTTVVIRSGALALACTLVGYAVYELALLPAAGFPSDDMRVIMAGVSALRVGHWLKLGYGLAIGVVLAGLTLRLRTTAPQRVQFALVAGCASVTLFVASGMLGLRILDVAEGYYPADLTDARATILVRVVTQSLQSAGVFAAGWFAVSINSAAWRSRLLPRELSALAVCAGVLLIVAFVLPDPLWLIGPFAFIVYAFALAILRI